MSASAASARRWCSEFLAANVADGTIEVVGARRRRRGGARLRPQGAGLPADACYTDPAEAFAAPPAPISARSSCRPTTTRRSSTSPSRMASTFCARSRSPTRMAASLRIARKVREAGRKMAVTMSHRFDQDKTTLRQIVRSGRLGRVNTVSCRYAADLREHMAWGALFRHTMQDPLMIEGAVHHLDLVADLAGAPCETHLRQHLETGLGGLCRRYRRHRDDDLRERRARRLRGHVSRCGRPERLEPRVCPRRLRARHRDPEQSRDRDLRRAAISCASALARARARRSS